VLALTHHIHIQRFGQGVPLVLFHGWGFDSRIWRPLVPTLERSYSLYCVDLPGFGGTDYMDWMRFQTGLFSQLPPTVALMGWSLGGLVATRLCLELPHRVTHLLNVASSPCFVAQSGWPGLGIEALTRFGERLLNDPENVLQEFMALQLPGQPEKTHTSTTIEGLKTGLDWLINWDFREKLGQIHCPILYLFGTRDAIIPRKTMSAIQARFPGIHCMMIHKAAHALFLSHAEPFIKAVEEFYLYRTGS
jgi:pimeloyl-[acyl-carrier protein] methyl ester esterase